MRKVVQSCVQSENKFANRFSLVPFFVKKIKSKILYKMCPGTFSFRDRRHRQTAQGIKDQTKGHSYLHV